MNYVVLWCQIVLATVFAVAVRGKLSRSAFHEFVGSTGRLLPVQLRNVRRTVAAAVVAGELAVVVLALIPETKLLGFLLAGGLSGAFGIGVAGALRRGERAPCRCFGASHQPLGGVHLARDIVLFGLAVFGSVAATALPTQGILLSGAMLTLAVGVVGAVLLIRLDDLAALFAPGSTTTKQGSRT